jgi:hypothetical protein
MLVEKGSAKVAWEAIRIQYQGSRFMETLASDHLVAVKHLLRYIPGTLNHGCVYRHSDSAELIGFSDSDHADDVDSRKSTSGVLFFLSNSPVR